MQVKSFDNGIKTVLKRQKGNRPALMQVFDSTNCMIAQREIKSVMHEDGSKKFEKITLRQEKQGNGQIEYLSVLSDPTSPFGWFSRRVVYPANGDSVYVNQSEIDGYGDKYLEYHQECINKNIDFQKLIFPFVKPTIMPMSKLDEMKQTLSNMWQQWHTPQGTPRKKVKPLMSKSVKKQFEA